MRGLASTPIALGAAALSVMLAGSGSVAASRLAPTRSLVESGAQAGARPPVRLRVRLRVSPVSAEVTYRWLSVPR